MVKSGSENLDTTSVTGVNEKLFRHCQQKAEYGRDLQYLDCHDRLFKLRCRYICRKQSVRHGGKCNRQRN
ncbi:MAG: hypothetical protein L6V93_13540 [Clostridiales bacterium]|nr:MAG: hypothetical protein L6V93_13540 [Clostridiales bacterium]